MRLGLTGRIGLGLGTALLMLASVSGVSFITIRRFSENSRAVAHSYDVLASLHQLRSRLAAATASARGYTLVPTGSVGARFLLRYQEARSNVAGLTRDLRAKTSDDPRQQGHLEIAMPLVMERLVQLDETVRLAQAGQPDRARDLIASAAVQEASDRMRLEMDSMVDEQQSRLAVRIADTERANREVVWSILAACLLTFAVAAWSAWQVRLEVRDKARAERAEREARKLLDGITENCNAVVFAKDRQGRLLLANRYMAEVYGRDLADLVGAVPYELVSPAGSAILREHDERVWNSDRPMEFEETLTINGQEHTFLSVKYPLHDDRGRPFALGCVSTDISARKEDEVALAAAKDAAEQASKVKDQFLSTMSHELRTPLNAVIGFAELLSDDRYGPLNDRQRRYIQNIQTGGRTLVELINEILDLSKIEAGRLDLLLENVTVEKAIQDVVASLRPLADKKSQTLSVEPAPGLVVRADLKRLRQVMTNLLGNAIKFTPDGGRIAVAATVELYHSRISVQDNGPGINEEDLKRIFDLFYRSKEARWKEGAGLGLTIARRLVEAHGGAFNLKSAPGQGTCFSFTLPLGIGIDAVEEVPAAAARGTVLIVENDPASAQLTESQLVSGGYRVLRCEDPVRAVQMAEELQPDAITLDVLMEPIHGWEILARLKQGDSTRGIPVLLVTVVDQRPVGAILGADAYLVKPVEKDDLLRALDQCLARQPKQVNGETQAASD